MLSDAKYSQMDLWDRRQLDSDLQARIEEKSDFDEAYEYLWKKYIQKTTSKDLGNNDKYVQNSELTKLLSRLFYCFQTV